MAVAAGLAIWDIDAQRTEAGRNNNRPSCVFVIDCLKHPEEAKVLRLVYGPSFFLVGIICDREIRLENLRRKYTGAPDQKLEALMEIDAAEEAKQGQQVRKTLPLSDFFVNQNCSVRSKGEPPLDPQIRRLLGLALGTEVHRPDKDERGMYAAWGAAMRSACLSRQVGAAIVNPAGIVIATGTNDVPAAGGGTYGNESEQDARCFVPLNKTPARNLAERQRNKIRHRILEGEGDGAAIQEHKPFCRSEFTKEVLYEVISQKLNQALHARTQQNQGTPDGAHKAEPDPPFSKKMVEDILKATPIKDLVEFSRAIHAEADAIVSLARAGGPSCQGASLYVNVFPCHLCTRQIIASGIAEVIYIEPYPKSLATILHDDALFDPETKDGDKAGGPLVKFRLFSGVAPRRYVELFERPEELKEPGSGGSLIDGRKRPQDPLFSLSHRQFEKTIAEEVKRLFPRAPSTASEETKT